MRIIIAAVCALLPFAVAVAAADMPMPRMLKGMQKGQWRVDMLENSMAKPGQQMPAMTICTDNLMKHSAEKSAKSECKQRLVKDSADEAVMEMTCPDHTVTATMKRESAKAVLIDVKSAGKGGPHNMKMRYTSLGACREGQATMSYDKNSEQCKKMQSAAAKMDPAKDCAGAGAQRAQCEQMIRQHIAQMKAMCN
jgi:hypothetical protein